MAYTRQNAVKPRLNMESKYQRGKNALAGRHNREVMVGLLASSVPASVSLYHLTRNLRLSMYTLLLYKPLLPFPFLSHSP